MAPFTLFAHCWPPGCVTCIDILPWIALLALSVSIELVSSSARITSAKSQQGLGQTSGPKDRTPGLESFNLSEKMLGKHMAIILKLLNLFHLGTGMKVSFFGQLQINSLHLSEK